MKNLAKAGLYLIPFLLTIVCQAQKLEFVKNVNQWQDNIIYQADIQSGRVFFTENAFRYSFYDSKDLEHVHHLLHEKGNVAHDELIDCYAYDMHFVGANAQPEIRGVKKAKQYRNYFIGNDQSKWAGNVPVFEGIQYQEIYNNIDINVYGEGTSFKYDYIVKPSGNAGDIKFAYTGIRPSITEEGNLKFDMPFMSVAEANPITYQIIDGQKKFVKARYKKIDENSFGFEILESYDKSIDLIIDPTLIFATYSGSTTMTFGFSATYGPVTGYLYAGGEAFGTGWPVSVGAYQVTFGGSQDAGINVYDALGTSLIYSTYYGGSGTDLPNNMIVNDAEELAICGSTTSSNLPTTMGAYDATIGGTTDLYVARFNSAGTALLGATYVGGTGIDGSNDFSLSPNGGDANRGELFYDSNGDLIIASSTKSSDFPVTAGAYQTTFGGAQDGCVFNLSANCATLISSTFLGGSGLDACFSIDINSSDDIVVAGGTQSANFPTTAGAYQTTAPGGTDGFVSVLSSTLATLNSSSFLGTTSFDHAFKIQVDNTDTIYLCGQSDGAFPVSPGAYTNAGGEIFIAVMAPDATSLTRSTLIGGSITPAAFLKDNCGNVYFTGYNSPSNLPTTSNAIQSTASGFWLSVLDQTLGVLVYATYFASPGDHIDGGTSRFDPQGVVYQSVCCGNNTFPVTPGAYATTKAPGASWDVASYKIDFELSGVQSDFDLSPNDTGCAPHTINFTNNSVQGVSFLWDFGDGNTSTASSPSHTYTTAGTYTIRLISMNVNSCIEADTSYATAYVLPSVVADFTTEILLGCLLDTVNFTNVGQVSNPATTSYAWDFGDANFSNNASPTHVYGIQNNYTVECIASDGFCADTFTAAVDIRHPINASFDIPTDSICLGNSITIVNTSSASLLSPAPQLFINDWDMGDGNTLVNNTPAWTYSYQSPGLYTISLQITDTLGCIDTFQMNVFVDDSAYATFSATPTELCLGEIVRFDNNVSVQALNTVYDFDDGTILANQNDPLHTYENPGIYNVTMTADFLVCPTASETITITVNDMPRVDLGPDTSWCPGVTKAIKLEDVNNPAQIMQWSDGSNAPSLIADTFGRYWAMVANGNCEATDSIWVKRDCYLNIPNSFSPNGDGRNDYFLPRQLLSSGLKDFSMKIMNRWGEIIFETSTIDGRGWDGKYGGQDQPIGVYVYMISAQWNNNYRNSFTGNVTLMR